MNNNSKLILGFTLAEVLITLGIIGVIAAITIPVIVNVIQDAQYKTAYKKAYSIASQAWLQLASENLLEGRNGWGANASDYHNFNQFMGKFSIVKNCTTSNISSCWATNETAGTMWNIPFDGNSHYVSFIDKSGTSWCNANDYGFMLIDTNGLKSPNQYGKDRFMLYEIVHGGDSSTPGIPNYLWAPPDYNYDAAMCPAGAAHPCYYTKWLYN